MKSDGVNQARPMMIAFGLAEFPYSNKYVALGFCRDFERVCILIGPGEEASGERAAFARAVEIGSRGRR